MGTQTPPDERADFVTALLSKAMIHALERYIAEEAPGWTRSDALRQAFKEWCVDRGYINPNDVDRELS
jgi:hypothetical protein